MLGHSHYQTIIALEQAVIWSVAQAQKQSFTCVTLATPSNPVLLLGNKYATHDFLNLKKKNHKTTLIFF